MGGAGSGPGAGSGGASWSNPTGAHGTRAGLFTSAGGGGGGGAGYPNGGTGGSGGGAGAGGGGGGGAGSSYWLDDSSVVMNPSMSSAGAVGDGSLAISYPPPTTATVTSSQPDGATYGQAVTFTATFTSSQGTPIGSAVFTDGLGTPILLGCTNSSYYFVPLVNGTASAPCGRRTCSRVRISSPPSTPPTTHAKLRAPTEAFRSR